ncbi:MAG: hypothetical protein WCW44_05475 [archaeon]|jgi:hypothetical protein
MLKQVLKRSAIRTTIKVKKAIQKFRIGSYFAGKARHHESATRFAYAEFGRGLLSKIKPIIISKGTPIGTTPNGAGKSFVVMPLGGTYEAEQTIGVIKGSEPNHFSRPQAWLGLGFKENAVIVESMQTRKEAIPALNAFRRATKKQALNFMLKEVEEKARELGFSEVKIRTPETLFFFHFPHKVKSPTLSDKQIRAQMKVLYARVASAEGYKREGIFYVKRL